MAEVALLRNTVEGQAWPEDHKKRPCRPIGFPRSMQELVVGKCLDVSGLPENTASMQLINSLWRKQSQQIQRMDHGWRNNEKQRSFSLGAAFCTLGSFLTFAARSTYIRYGPKVPACERTCDFRFVYLTIKTRHTASGPIAAPGTIAISLLLSDLYQQFSRQFIKPATHLSRSKAAHCREMSSFVRPINLEI